jgi:hypothetical protein
MSRSLRCSRSLLTPIGFRAGSSTVRHRRFCRREQHLLLRLFVLWFFYAAVALAGGIVIRAFYFGFTQSDSRQKHEHDG